MGSQRPESRAASDPVVNTRPRWSDPSGLRACARLGAKLRGGARRTRLSVREPGASVARKEGREMGGWRAKLSRSLPGGAIWLTPPVHSDPGWYGIRMASMLPRGAMFDRGFRESWRIVWISSLGGGAERHKSPSTGVKIKLAAPRARWSRRTRCFGSVQFQSPGIVNPPYSRLG